MKSLRLNKEMRENILSNFVAKYLVANPTPELSLDEDNLKSEVAKSVQQKLYGKYAGLVPLEMLHTNRYISLKLPNDSLVQWYFLGEDGNYQYLPKTKESKVEYCLEKDDPIWIAYEVKRAIYKEQATAAEDHRKALNKFKNEVKQVLDSVNTTLQLVEVWPEALPFVPQEISNPSSINLPSVNFAELNKVIG